MKRIAFVAKNSNDIPLIKKQLKEKGIKNIDVFSEPPNDKYDFIELNVEPNKEYANIYDFTNNLIEHGLIEHRYDPISSNQSKSIERLNGFIDRSKNDIVSFTQVDFKTFVEEIKELEKQDIRNLTVVQLIDLFRTTANIPKLADIANEIHYRKHGWRLSASAMATMKENMARAYAILDAYGKGNATLKAYKTRLRNILNQNKKLAAMIYFPDFWLQQMYESHPWWLEEADEVF